MTTIPRVAPTSKVPLTDGFKTKIAFASDPDVAFWENSSTPPGIDGGEKVAMSNMFNVDWHTDAPQALKRLTDSSLNAFWNPKYLAEVLALINVNGWITVTFSDGTTLDFVGYLQSAIPQSFEIGQPPMIAIKINPTNRLNTGVETVPVITPGT